MVTSTPSEPPSPAVCDLAALTNWLLSWVDASGEIRGFHNHSVWGDNPYRWGDFTSGHSTWASPLIPALVEALRQQPDARALALVQQLIRFQTASFQPNGQYEHIGFQVGETLKHGLIHNAIANAALCQAAWRGHDILGGESLELIQRAVLHNMESCRIYGNDRASKSGTCNQEYARIWAKLLFQLAFDDSRWRDQIVQDLDFMIEHFHVDGFPDATCEATLRTCSDPGGIEPGEYYGLMICPLVLAYQVYGEQRFLDHAGRLARHVIRSAWQDCYEQTRMHRLYFRDGPRWRRMCEPMLIAGMGDSLEGIYLWHQINKDEEAAAFLDQCDATYSRYQNGRGFFAAATGWASEVDIAPSSAWHAHDLRYLLRRHTLGTTFWDRCFTPDDRTAVLLGDQCLWVERGAHWCIGDYWWQDVFCLLGRKDRSRFGRDMTWVGGERTLPDEFRFDNIPVFRKTEAEIVLLNPGAGRLVISSIATLPIRTDTPTPS
ncbi:MAG: hypothetical protein M1546_08130 [Chloroflexi bacterium]|nr:hypothetical protein [Chloroflexota bacterium]